jgi:hypothetical protein
MKCPSSSAPVDLNICITSSLVIFMPVVFKIHHYVRRAIHPACQSLLA